MLLRAPAVIKAPKMAPESGSYPLWRIVASGDRLGAFADREELVRNRTAQLVHGVQKELDLMVGLQCFFYRLLVRCLERKQGAFRRGNVGGEQK